MHHRYDSVGTGLIINATTGIVWTTQAGGVGEPPLEAVLTWTNGDSRSDRSARRGAYAQAAVGGDVHEILTHVVVELHAICSEFFAEFLGYSS